VRGKSGVGVVVGLFFAAMAAAGAASDWPTYMHDRSRAGVSPDSLSTPMARAWSFDSPVPPERAFSGPENRAYEGSRVLRSRIRFDDAFQVAMAGGGVFFGSSVDGRIHCIDAATGAGRWTFFTGGPVRLAPTVSGGRVYAGSDDGCVYCLDAGSGELVWKLRAGPRDDRLLARGRMTSRWPVRTGILVDGGIAYFGAGVFPADTVYLYAVDAATGKVVWKNDWLSERDANRSDFSPQGYMLATDKTLFVPSGRSLPAAIDRAGGDMLFQSRPRWRDAAGGAVGGTDALLAAGQIYSVGEHHILAMDQKRGKTGFGWFLATRMTMDAKTAYMANGKEIIAVDHAKRAEASRKRHALELKRMVVVRQIAAHPAPKLLKDATRLEAKLKAARTRLEKLSSAGARTSPEHAAAKKAAAKAEAAYRAAAAKYEPARKAFNKLRETRKSMEAQIAKLKTVAIKWRFATPYESSLILAGKTLVAGGKGGVLVLDAGSGKLLWKHVVAGEARGLAVAGGRLVVSTAKGHVVCFAPGGKTAGAGRKPRLRMVPPAPVPYPPDGLSALYADAAESILAATGVRRGYCLVLGAGEGRLAYEIARRSDLTVFGVSPDRKAVDAGREKLAATGLYGTRITLDALEPGAPIPYPDYFANLIVSDSLVKTGEIPGNAVAVARFLKPVGGMICLGVPGGADAAGPAAAARWLDATGLPANGEASVATHGGWTVLTRGKLPGAGDWTQEYGNAGNTSSNEGERMRGGLQVLWYGDPGPGEMVNRHYAAVAPVSANGRFFIENIHSVQAYDAYNGLLLWEFGNRGADIGRPTATRTPETWWPSTIFSSWSTAPNATNSTRPQERPSANTGSRMPGNPMPGARGSGPMSPTATAFSSARAPARRASAPSAPRAGGSLRTPPTGFSPTTPAPANSSGTTGEKASPMSPSPWATVGFTLWTAR
jgi:outer membrane protein assembly factor BamB